MDEYWVCQHCRSLNRAASARCYSCGKKFGSKPPTVENTGQAPKAAAPPPSPYAPAPIPPASSPTYSSTQPPVAAPSYLSRPVAPVNVQTPYLTETQPKGRFPSPGRSVERRISAALAVRPSVSVSAIGWVALLSMAVLFAISGLLTMTGLPAASYALQHADLPGGWNQLTSGQRGLLGVLLIAEVAAGLVALFSFSTFVGLSTHNTTGLGAETTLLMPGSGFKVWPSLVWFHVKTALALIAPVVVIYYGYEVVGLILGVLVVEVAQRHSDDALDWLDRPAHHLPELHRKLGTEGAARDGMVAEVWSTAFRMANLSAVALYLMPAIGLTVAVAMKTSGKDLKLWQETGLGVGQLAFVAVAAVFAVSAALTLLATMAMILGLMRRQQTRRTLVRVGRSRPWTTRPGEGAYLAAAAGAAGPVGAGAQAGAAGFAGAGSYAGAAGAAASGVAFGSSGYPENLVDEDRVIERRPFGAASGWPGAQPPAPEGSTPQWPGPRQPMTDPTTPRWPGAEPAAPSAAPLGVPPAAPLGASPAAPLGASPAAPLGASPAAPLGASPAAPLAPPSGATSEPAPWPDIRRPAPDAGTSPWPGARPSPNDPAAWPGPTVGPTVGSEPIPPARAWPAPQPGMTPRPPSAPSAPTQSDAPASMGAFAPPPPPPVRPTPPTPGPAMPPVMGVVTPPPTPSARPIERAESGESPRPASLMSRVQSGLAAQAQQAAQHPSQPSPSAQGVPSAQENGAPSSGAPSSSPWDIRRDVGGGDQASLNSPSTTSSSPWEPSPDESSEE